MVNQENAKATVRFHSLRRFQLRFQRGNRGPEENAKEKSLGEEVEVRVGFGFKGCRLKTCKGRGSREEPRGIR